HRAAGAAWWFRTALCDLRHDRILMNCPHCNAPNADDARFCGECGRATTGTAPASQPGLGPPTEQPELVGREIAGRFRLLAKLGEGGMGAVYRAEQISMKRAVAVKLLRPEVA